MSTSSELILRSSNNLPAVIDGNSLFSYLEKIKKFPILTDKEELDLVTSFQQKGDLSAAQRLVTSHLRLAAKVALSYRRYGLPMSDIISEANIGLMQAVKKFDLDKKVRLATYAVWWIRAAINDYILRSWSLVKIGTKAAQKKLFYNLSRLKSRLGIYDNRELAPDAVKKIADELVVDEADVIEMNRRMSGDKSLNVSVSDEDDNEKIDLLVDSRQNIEERLSRRQEQSRRNRILSSCLSQLTEREQQVIKARMLRENPQTLEELGTKLGVSRERIRQIEKKAFERLSVLVREQMAELDAA
ncbi:MAG: RNA polymerase factor sigma-32 [Alphaproteobacteria bacterium]|nr:RNA polymerase factor sigma-32 [Alphaproteobacteria bacterium]MBQ8630579.1 RNA polymerase factor sigma-32 [Alphaproteobacteria bacterium]